MNRTRYIFLGLLIVFSVILARCQSTPTGRIPLPEHLEIAEADREQLQAMATTFDKFLTSKLSTEEFKSVKQSCLDAPEKNPFCFSILNLNYFDRKTEVRKRKKKRRKRFRRVYPKFRKKSVRNWQQLRFASINSTINSTASVSRARLEVLKKRALNEKKCPNNIAVSVAATLEDHLPDNSDTKEIAKLYEIGGDCIPTRDDRRSIVTRAGMFYFLSKDYESALSAFTKASEIERSVISRPLYWRYRTLMAMDRDDDAKEALRRLKEKYPFSFHSIVAQTANNDDPGKELLKSFADHLQKRSQQVPTVNLLIEQVEILHHFGFAESANQVLSWAITESSEVEPEVKVYLAELKQNDSDHIGRISLLSNVLYENPDLISRKTLELYFPKPYFPIFESNQAGVDPFLLMAIARQESAFNPRAVSRADALGLLQVLPRVGRQISKAGRKDLMTPETNIKVGSIHFLDHLKKLNGQVHLALAAYNAGFRKVTAWSKRYQTDEPILFIDICPYRETRDYVGLVLRNYYWYRRINTSQSHEILKKVDTNEVPE